MTSTEQYFISLIFIIMTTMALGAALHYPIAFAKGRAAGLRESGDIWEEVIGDQVEEEVL